MSSKNSPSVRLGLLALGLWFAGCQGVDQVKETHYRLETAYEHIERERYPEAIELLDTALADLQPEHESFVLQRFYVNYLMTQAQLLKALTELSPEDDENFRNRRINPRVMTALLHVGDALDLAEEAASTPRTTEDGQQLLPGRVDSITVEEARGHLNLLVVGFYGGLRFNDRMRIALDRLRGLGELGKYQGFLEILDRVRVIEGVRPWLLVAVNRAIRDTDPREAYKFGIAALHHEKGRLNRLTREELIDWVNAGSDYRFLCTQCDQKVLPERPDCYNCGTSYLDAYGVEKEPTPTP